MEKIKKILSDHSLEDDASQFEIWKKLKSVSNTELHYYLAMQGTNTKLELERLKHIGLARQEVARRDAARIRNLTLMATVVSGGLALFGVWFGGYIERNASMTTSAGETATSEKD